MHLGINTVTIIGGNGTLGKTVAGIFASFGNAKVYLISRTKDKSKKAIIDAALSVKALTVKDNMVACDYKDLKKCVSESDLVFESVSEDINLKKEIHKSINKYAKESCIVSTGTSGLSIDELADCYSDKLRKNFVGIHFFNPPYSLNLCELTPSKYSIHSYIENLEDYLSNVLYRSVIITKNQPAFLANRIGFKFLNEALIYANEYKNKGGIDYIDSILGCYTGRSMAPMQTINFVGLDVHKAIVDNVYNTSTDTNEKNSFKLPKYVNSLIDNGKLGLKVGEGLYKKTSEGLFVYDIKSKKYRSVKKYDFEFKNKAINCFRTGDYKEGFNYIINDNTEESKICMTFLLNYIVYSLKQSKTSSKKVTDCDIAMAKGFNWIPPIALIDALGGIKEVKGLCKKYLNNTYNEVFKSVPNSNFKYEKYIKAMN